jgi:branched-chain amino acid transport system substrate-binding protein
MKQKNYYRIIGVALFGFVVAWLLMASKCLAASAQGVTDDTILIGIHTPLTGPSALYSKIADLHEAIYLEWGKDINGRKIKVIKLDDACDPVKGVAAVKKLIYDEKVFLIDGGNCSNVSLAAKPIVEKEGIPYLILSSVSDSIVIPPVKNIFNPGLVSSSASKTLVDFAMTVPAAKNFGVIRQTDEWGTSLYSPLVKYLKGKYNMNPVIEVVAERDAADLTPQILKLKNAKVDLVFNLVYIVATTTFLRDAHKLGLNVPILGSTATSPMDQFESLKTLDPLKKFFAPYWCKYPMDHPKVKVLESLFYKYQRAKKFDAITIITTGGAQVVIDALKKSGRDLSWGKFCDILETQYSNWAPEDYIGASPITFSKEDHVGMDRMIMSTMGTGKFELVNTYQEFEKLLKK